MGVSAQDLLMAGRGAVRTSSDSSRCRRLNHLASIGALTRVLPGVFVAPAAAHEPAVLARAALLSCPAGIVSGRAAAALTFWPELAVSTIQIATRFGRDPIAPFEFPARINPADLITDVDGIRLTHPALTALDLCTGSLGPAAIDRALQVRAVTVPDLLTALELTPHRRRNDRRRALLREVKSEGCSPLERRAHRVLRRAGITDWVANRRYRACGQDVRPDIRFRRVKMIIEFDGFAYHSSREAFDQDRKRGNLLPLAGFTVLRYTDATLDDEVEFLQQVRHGLRIAPPY
ncbi:MAG: endonuclease domain-containing protein [Actinomycetota bacterium]|nr:endonuclease domain-containing protein [Actinomycetota bacterium]